MILTDQKIINLFNSKIQSSKSLMQFENIEGMIFNKMCLGSITVNPLNLKNIQYLSLKNNFLSDITFLKHLTNLYYFDISKNSIEDLEPLNTKSAFGYLHLTLGQFNDKKLLTLKGMTIGIFEVEMQDYTLCHPFLISNPNIIVLNKDIVYFSDRFLPQEDEIKNTTKSKSLLVQKSIKPKDKFLNSQSIDIPFTNSSLFLHQDSNGSSSMNKEISKLLQFYTHYNNNLYSILSKLQKPSANILSSDLSYKDMERMKLKVLADIYYNIIKLTSRKEAFLMYKAQMSNINLFDFTILQVKDIKNQLVILILLLLYILQMITKELVIITLNYILKHFIGISDKNLIQSDLFYPCHLIGIYYIILDTFIESYNKRKELQLKDNNNTLEYHNVKYDQIIRNLKMDSIILKGNYLNQISKDINSNHKKKGNLSIENDLKRFSVKWKYSILKQLKLNEPILFLMQFLCDYIYSSELNKILSDAVFDDYVSLNETKDYLYKLASEKFCFTLSEKKFHQNRLSHLSNRLFLSKRYSSNEDKFNLNEDTILTSKGTRLYFDISKKRNYKTNDHPKVDNNSHCNVNNRKSIFDNLRQVKKQKKLKLTLDIEDNFSDDNLKKQKIDLKQYLNIKKISQLSTSYCNSNDIELNSYQLTNTAITSCLLPNMKLKVTTNPTATILIPNSKVNKTKSPIELWRNYKSVKLRKKSNQKSCNEINTETTESKFNKSLNIPFTSIRQHNKTKSYNFPISKRDISQSKNIISMNKTRNSINCTPGTRYFSPTTTLSNIFITNYHPILTQKKIKQKQKNSKRNNKSYLIRPFLSKIELQSLFTVRKYNMNQKSKK